jgi:hypothetical protein
VGDLTFPGVEQDKFQHYVLFNTARHAWEQYKFEMRVVPEDWRRKPVPTPTNLSVAGKLPKLYPEVVTNKIQMLLSSTFPVSPP